MGDFVFVPADKVTELLRKGKRCVEDTACMIWDRAQIEKDYGKHLKRWAEKYRRKLDGTDSVYLHTDFLESVKVLLKEADEKAKLHQGTYECFMQQDGPHHRLLKYHTGADSGRSFLVLPHAKMQNDVERSLDIYKTTVDNYCRLLATIDKYKQRYAAMKEELKVLTQEYGRKEAKYMQQGRSMSKLERIKNQMCQKQSHLEMIKTRWNNSLKKEEDSREEAKQTLDTALECIIKVEERRLAFMIKQLIDYTNILAKQTDAKKNEFRDQSKLLFENLDEHVALVSWQNLNSDVFLLPHDDEQSGDVRRPDSTSSDPALRGPPWITNSGMLGETLARLDEACISEGSDSLRASPVNPYKRASSPDRSSEKIALSRRSQTLPNTSPRHKPRLSISSGCAVADGRGSGDLHQQHSVRSEQVLSTSRQNADLDLDEDDKDDSMHDLSNTSIEDDEARVLSELGAVGVPVGSSRSTEPRLQHHKREGGPRLSQVQSELIKHPPGTRAHVGSRAAEGDTGLTDVGITPADGDSGVMRTQPINRRLRNSPGRLELNKATAASPARRTNQVGPAGNFFDSVARTSTAEVVDVVSSTMAAAEVRKVMTRRPRKSAEEVSFTEIQEFQRSDEDKDSPDSESEYI